MVAIRMSKKFEMTSIVYIRTKLAITNFMPWNAKLKSGMVAMNNERLLEVGQPDVPVLAVATHIRLFLFSQKLVQQFCCNFLSLIFVVI